MKKRILSFSLVLSLVLALVPMAFATPLPDYEFNAGDILVKSSIVTPHDYLGEISIPDLYFMQGYNGDIILYPNTLSVFIVDGSDYPNLMEHMYTDSKKLENWQTSSSWGLSLIDNKLTIVPMDVGNTYGNCAKDDPLVFSYGCGINYVRCTLHDTDNENNTYDIWSAVIVLTKSELAEFKSKGTWPESITNEYIGKGRDYFEEYLDEDDSDISKYLDLSNLKAILLGTSAAAAPIVTIPAPTPAPVTPATGNTAELKTTDGLNSVIPPVPTAGKDLAYTVQKSEKLWSIAFNYYGSMQKAVVDRIYGANAAYFAKTKGVLEAGAVITLPAKGLITPVTQGSLSKAAGMYLVKSGDTLGAIAKLYYGDVNQWKKIQEANKDRVKVIGGSPMIYEGQWLVIPE